MLFLASEENTTKERQQPKKKKATDFFVWNVDGLYGTLSHTIYAQCIKASKQQSLCNIFKS
jgi:hypothetical protein